MNRMKNFAKILLLFIVAGIAMTIFSTGVYAGGDLTIFAGAALKPPTEQAAKVFENKTGIKVDLNFGAGGTLISQMILSKQGDIYFAPSSDFMELAKMKGVVFPETEKRVVYLVPALLVQKGNPKKIKSLRDLTRPGLRVAIANPAVGCIGVYAVQIIEKSFSPEEKAAFRKNVVNYAASCDQLSADLSLKTVDAIIGWRIFGYWDPKRIEIIPLKKSEIVRLNYGAIAISRFTKQRDLARKFINFVLSDEGKAIFRKYHYFTTPDEAFSWIGEKKPVGGPLYVVPKEWITPPKYI